MHFPPTTTIKPGTLWRDPDGNWHRLDAKTAWDDSYSAVWVPVRPWDLHARISISLGKAHSEATLEHDAKELLAAIIAKELTLPLLEWQRDAIWAMADRPERDFWTQAAEEARHGHP